MFYYIRFPVVNMYINPDEMSEVDSQAIYGTPVEIVEAKQEWKKIKTPDSYQGWVTDKEIFTRSNFYPKGDIEAKINTIMAHIYYVSDTKPHHPKMTLPFDTRIEVIVPSDMSARWWKVTLVDGSEGWVQKGDIELKPKNLSIEDMAQLSEKFLGLPYTWGGVSSLGFDCSGLVQRLYKQMGITLPRNSSQQANDKRGIEIKKGALQKGDLLFFGLNQKVTHVGMFLENGKFIHAKANLDGSPIVQIHKLNEPKWEEPFLFAKRFVYQTKSNF